MQLTVEQVQQMAPDEASAAAGKKLQFVKHWQNLGKSEQALWGECLGSATYQVKVDLSNLGYKCTCPSRKFPCKHVLGLLLMAAITGKVIPQSPQPDWITEWLSKRGETAAKKEARAAQQADKPVDEKAQLKRAEQRHDRVSDGLKHLDLWLQDLVRGGLAGLEQKGSGPWEEQARRLIDAQAPGLAARMRRLGELPGSSPAWPGLLLGELGKIKLALHAFRRIDQLDPALASDLRQWIGWTISTEELEKAAEKVADDWLIVGQWVDEDDRLRMQRTWCLGKSSGRLALVLQFVAGPGQFPITFMPGTQLPGAMLFYPGAARQRAQFQATEKTFQPITERLRGHLSIEHFLKSVAETLALQPWLNAFGCVLENITLARSDQCWFIRDSTGHALPLIAYDAWQLLAMTGGHPFDLAGEWNGQELRPLGGFIDGVFRILS